MKYIDADALKIEIKHHIELMENEPTRYARARTDEANEILSVIASLQQEHSEDLEEAAKDWVFDNCFDCDVVGEHKAEEAYIAGAQWQKEQSEEYEKNYEYLHQVICTYINNPQIEYKEREKASKELIPFLERLKSLRPQPKQEWTIKDAKPGDILTTDTVTFIFKSVDKRFVSMYCSYAVSTDLNHINFSDTSTVDSEYVHPASVEQRQEFLEELLRYLSLQPHWKPSEEQMNSLKAAIEEAKEYPEAGTNWEQLQGIFDQLNKL